MKVTVNPPKEGIRRWIRQTTRLSYSSDSRDETSPPVIHIFRENATPKQQKLYDMSSSSQKSEEVTETPLNYEQSGSGDPARTGLPQWDGTQRQWIPPSPPSWGTGPQQWLSMANPTGQPGYGASLPQAPYPPATASHPWAPTGETGQLGNSPSSSLRQVPPPPIHQSNPSRHPGQPQWSSDGPPAIPTSSGLNPQEGSSTASPPSLLLRFASQKSDVLNADVVNNHGRAIYRVQSDRKSTGVFDYNNRVLAVVDWHHSNPRLTYYGSKMKVNEWIPMTEAGNGRFITHSGRQYTWRETSGLFVLKSSAGRTVARCNANGYVEVEVLPEGLQLGLEEPVLLSVILMASGRPLGD